MGTNERSAASTKLRKQQRAFEQDRLSRAIRFEFYLKRLCGVAGAARRRRSLPRHRERQAQKSRTMNAGLRVLYIAMQRGTKIVSNKPEPEKFLLTLM
jgi:hypothetical protein